MTIEGKAEGKGGLVGHILGRVYGLFIRGKVASKGKDKNAV